MGGCLSRDKAYTVLRDSIPGSLIQHEKDFDDFFRLCKTEMHTISSVLHLDKNQAFYVVVAGEVTCSLTDQNDDTIIVNTFKVGEMIPFFRTGTILAGAMIAGEIKLNLAFKSIEGRAVVIGLDYDSIDYYLEMHKHCSSMKQFFDLNWNDFSTLPSFQSLSIQQVSPSTILLFVCYILTFFLFV
jgi:hypothetical protein